MSSDISNREAKEVWLPVFSIAAGTFATVTTGMPDFLYQLDC